MAFLSELKEKKDEFKSKAEYDAARKEMPQDLMIHAKKMDEPPSDWDEKLFGR